jgi:hypothetical protein
MIAFLLYKGYRLEVALPLGLLGDIIILKVITNCFAI